MINESFDINLVSWTNEYSWARKRIAINDYGPKPKNFHDLLNIGDFIYLKDYENFYNFINSTENCILIDEILSVEI